MTNNSQENILLSICIATYNRAQYISETLDSISSQICAGLEVIIIDGASTDGTANVVEKYTRSIPRLQYKVLEEKGGVDKDFDISVNHASGKYCWLLSDDDPLKPGAIKRLMDTLDNEPSLVIANAEVKSLDMSETVEHRRLKLEKNVILDGQDLDSVAQTIGDYITFIGCVIIKRDLWKEREREAYFGTEFIHVGVIFQKPLDGHVLIIAEPLLTIRFGNAQWTPRALDIWAYKWPNLIWGFSSISAEVKTKLVPQKPIESPNFLLTQKAKGNLTTQAYVRFMRKYQSSPKPLALLILAIPQSLLRKFLIFYYSKNKEKYAISLYDIQSR